MWPIDRLRRGANVGVALFPDFVAVARHDQVEPRALVHKLDNTTPTDWRRALAALPSLLESAGAKKGDRIACVFSNHFARLALVPWSSDMLDARRAEAAARDYLAATFGTTETGAAIRVDDAPYGQARMACAVDADLASDVALAATRVCARLVACTPLLSNASCLLPPAARHGGVVTFERGGWSYALFRNNELAAVGMDIVATDSARQDAGASAKAAGDRLRLRHPWLTSDIDLHAVSADIASPQMGAQSDDDGLHWVRPRAACSSNAEAVTRLAMQSH